MVGRESGAQIREFQAPIGIRSPIMAGTRFRAVKHFDSYLHADLPRKIGPIGALFTSESQIDDVRVPTSRAQCPSSHRNTRSVLGSGGFLVISHRISLNHPSVFLGQGLAQLT